MPLGDTSLPPVPPPLQHFMFISIIIDQFPFSFPRWAPYLERLFFFFFFYLYSILSSWNTWPIKGNECKSVEWMNKWMNRVTMSTLYLLQVRINKHCKWWKKTKQNNRGSWVAQWVRHPTSAQVMISTFVSLSPALGSVLTAQSLEPASDSVSPSLSAPPSLTPSFSLSKINIKKI